MIDEASSQAYGRFVGEDSAEENLRVQWVDLERWGRPVEFYTDKGSLFTVNRPAVDEAVNEEGAQIVARLAGTGIGWIAAYSPQAEGRLAKGLRLAQVNS